MQKFEGISFLWAVALIALIGLTYGLRAFLGYRNVARDAVEDYDYKQPQGMIDKRLTKDGYIRAYKRFHNPRGSAYVAATFAAILLLTWPAMGLLSVILELAYNLSGQNRVIEPGFLVWQFFIFFGIIITWTSIGYFMARRFHRRAPVSFRDEQIREMN